MLIDADVAGAFTGCSVRSPKRRATASSIADGYRAISERTHGSTLRGEDARACTQPNQHRR
jgi:hypothetical protein